MYIAEVPLGRFGHYEAPVYTFLCGITLGLFPLALIMTFAPFKTPWREAVSDTGARSAPTHPGWCM